MSEEETIKVIENMAFEYEIEFAEPIYSIKENLEQEPYSYIISIKTTYEYIKNEIKIFFNKLISRHSNKGNIVKPSDDIDIPEGYAKMKDE